MLILTRRTSESVMIGEDVTITVLGVKGTQVRIGITAPRNVPVHREEIYERIHAQEMSSEQKRTNGATNREQSHRSDGRRTRQNEFKERTL